VKPTKAIFAERVKAARKARGWTQADLARRAGLGQSYVSKVEHAGAEATLDVVDALARALRVEPVVLLRGRAS
jgi:transcriptional regulator with XRE-family HTH domain